MKSLVQNVVATVCVLFGLFSVVRSNAADPFVVVLGVAQDAGYPQAGCDKSCCESAWSDEGKRRFASCLAIVDPDSRQRWLLDCTPDFREQLRLLDEVTPALAGAKLSGIFPTHAHMGHYAGLMHLGREAMGANRVSVMAMPRMKYFLETNGPWSQLVQLEQIEVIRLASRQPYSLNNRLAITPFLVPHRDEFSETVGFEVQGPSRSIAYLPDIDKWERWENSVEDLIRRVDVAFLDGTFFDGDELPGRDMSEIPHPFVSESVDRFRQMPRSEREKIYFIHLNHTNPLIRDKQVEQLSGLSFQVAQQATATSTVRSTLAGVGTPEHAGERTGTNREASYGLAATGGIHAL